MNNNTKSRWKATTKAERIFAARQPRCSKVAKVGNASKKKD